MDAPMQHITSILLTKRPLCNATQCCYLTPVNLSRLALRDFYYSFKFILFSRRTKRVTNAAACK